MAKGEIKIQSAKPNRDLLSIHPEVRPGPGAGFWLAVGLAICLTLLALTLSWNDFTGRRSSDQRFSSVPDHQTSASARKHER